MSNLRRLNKEFSRITKKLPEGIQEVNLANDDINTWIITMSGPADTPYVGISMTMKLIFKNTYPHSHPSAYFISKVYHPNVSSEGSICISILKDSGWSPAFSVESVLMSIRSFLDDPNTDDPYDSTAAKLYNKNREEYTKRVREYSV